MWATGLGLSMGACAVPRLTARVLASNHFGIPDAAEEACSILTIVA